MFLDSQFFPVIIRTLEYLIIKQIKSSIISNPRTCLKSKYFLKSIQFTL